MSKGEPIFKYKQMPAVHKVAFFLARQGFRGSNWIWFLACLLKRIPNGHVQLPTGFILCVDDMDFSAKAIYRGWYENGILELLERLRIQHQFVDVGANLGLLSFHAVRYSTGIPIAFEPIQENVDKILASYQLMNRTINLYKIAISDSKGTAVIFGSNNPSHSGAASLVNAEMESSTTVEVQTDTLDGILLGLLTTSCFIKVDCEGGEHLVLSGAKTLFLKNAIKGLIVEVNPGVASIDYLGKIFAQFPIPFQAFFVREKKNIFIRKTIFVPFFPMDIGSIECQENVVFLSGRDLDRFYKIVKRDRLSRFFLLR